MALRSQVTRESLSILRGVDLDVALLVEAHDVVRLRRPTRDFHARGARRHAADGDALNGRLLLEKPADFGRRHVALDGIAADEGRVTRLCRARNTKLRLEAAERLVIHLGDLHGEAALLHMLDPLRAAAAGG